MFEEGHADEFGHALNSYWDEFVNSSKKVDGLRAFTEAVCREIAISYKISYRRQRKGPDYGTSGPISCLFS
jgi:hypothetical protein